MNFLKKLWENEDTKIVILALMLYSGAMAIGLTALFILIKLCES